MPFYIIWGIWWSRNALIFNQIKPDIRGICTIFYWDWTLVEKSPTRAMPNQRYMGKFLVGFFDGASSFRVCGSGVVIVVNPSHYFHFSWRVGEGTNNRVELSTLWGVLHCTKWLELQEIEVFEDSKLINYTIFSKGVYMSSGNIKFWYIWLSMLSVVIVQVFWFINFPLVNFLYLIES